MKKLIFLLLVSVFFLSAYDYKEDQIVEDYLPLQVGNYWNFGTSSMKHLEVVGLQKIDGREYYCLVTTMFNRNNVDIRGIDSAYYRMDTNGYVYVYRKHKEGKEENLFRLNGADGDSWTYPYKENGNEVQIKLSIESIVLGGLTLDCKNYLFDIKWSDDEEYILTLARGIGFVKEYVLVSRYEEILQSARINGKEFHF